MPLAHARTSLGKQVREPHVTLVVQLGAVHLGHQHLRSRELPKNCIRVSSYWQMINQNRKPRSIWILAVSGKQRPGLVRAKKPGVGTCEVARGHSGKCLHAPVVACM
jgi:hypothetical protein